MKENQPAKSKILLSLLLFLVLLFSYSISGFIGAQKATSAHAYSCSGTVLCDPYTRFSGYDSYLESFYQATQPIPGFRAYPIQDPSGGDYCNYWMDDAGKMLSAFAYLGDAQYATYASSFIMNNAIQQDGFYYLPERYVQGCSTYLHVNRTQLASPTYPISFGPVQNPSFELTNTINNQPLYWNTAASGSGTQKDIENSPGICADGSFCVATQASGSPGMAAYVQPVGGTTAFIFAHNDPAIGINGGIIGNFTASFLPVARQTSQSASSTNQMVFGYDSFPALSYDTVIPANSAFSLAAYVSANVSLTGVTFGVQVNEVCNNYGKETSPWGGEVTSTVSIGTAPALFKGYVPTGPNAVTVPAGCAFHFIVYLNPNTTHPYTFTIYWDSKSQEAYASYPWYTALADLYSGPSSFGIAIEPQTLAGSTSGFWEALISSGGTILLENGTVQQSDIPNLVSPVQVYSFNAGNLNQWSYVNFNGASLVGSLNKDSTLQAFEFGVDSTGNTNITAIWDDAFYLLGLGQGNAPWPAAGQWMTAGYYYANNGNIGVTNYSQIQHPRVDVYEKKHECRDNHGYRSSDKLPT
jgi:hypothetical protein